MKYILLIAGLVVLITAILTGQLMLLPLVGGLLGLPALLPSRPPEAKVPAVLPHQDFYWPDGDGRTRRAIEGVRGSYLNGYNDLWEFLDRMDAVGPCAHTRRINPFGPAEARNCPDCNPALAGLTSGLRTPTLDEVKAARAVRAENHRRPRPVPFPTRESQAEDVAKFVARQQSDLDSYPNS